MTMNMHSEPKKGSEYSSKLIGIHKPCFIATEAVLEVVCSSYFAWMPALGGGW